MEDKRLKDMTDEEFEEFMRGIKWDRFNKWAAGVNESEEAQRDIDEVARRTGLPKHSPLVLMATSFFAGVDAGTEITEAFLAMDDEEKATGKKGKRNDR